MALGKAFIEVHADTKPFARELGRELDTILSAAEKDVRASSGKLGETISDETGKGIKRNKKRIGDGINESLFGSGVQASFSKFAKGIVDTIDDGLSGLPAELKVILGAGLVAALPVAFALGAQIAGALTAGLALAGGAGIGVLLASQFEEVQLAAQDLFSFLRVQFLETGQSLVRPFLNAITLVRSRLVDLQPELVGLFNRIGDTIVPLADALIGLVEEFIPGFRRGFANIGEFLGPLQVGLRLIGEAAGNFFETILANDNAPDVLYDILLTVTNLIDLFTILVDVGLEFWGVQHDILEALGLLEDPSEAVTRLGKEFGIATEEQSLFGKSVLGTIAPLDAETKAIEELNKQIDLLTRLTFAQVDNQIAFEQGIDDLTESLRENKDTLDLNSQAGRDNANALLDLARTILETRADTIELTGDVSAAEAAFRAQRDEVYLLARQMGLSKTEVDQIIGSLLKIPAPKQSGVTASSLDRLEDFNQALRNTIYLQSLIDPTYNPQGPGGQQRFADGGIVTGPTNALIGEAGAEAVIPLTNPARAAEVMSQAGLTSMMSPTVNVYIGNEQIQAYIAVETNKQMGVAARSLAYGTRGI